MVDPSVRRSGSRGAAQKPPDRAPLDRDRILAAALRLMDADGLDALTMRRLAAELHVEAMSLYYHVPGKAVLLEGLAETVLGEIRLPRADGGDPAQATRSVARALRANALAHPNAIPLLGALFVGGQVSEFTAFYNEGLGFTTSRFSSAFYTLTGFHGVHVTVGIIMLMSMLFLSLRGKLPEHRSETVEVVGLYWHFVDVVWIFIFAVVYLIP
jgi:AcrR family transcriptional regulator